MMQDLQSGPLLQNAINVLLEQFDSAATGVLHDMLNGSH
jgi:hypothetical protein